MNQQILFNDRIEVDWSQQWIQFDAQWAGQVVPCLITIAQLAKLANCQIENIEQASAAFEQCRFDLEEQAELLIEEESFDPQGQVWLGHQPC
ncbi:DUF1488 domain-containing protein [Ferrimonas senticii]|uniref:DUF1488 domain-containing protein n=1 Tax=Ferrimonas senticii TaxID=394566 RepID=UPI0004046A29|nr:DUF1488 domain-containing protein [Ferrimonas senticii]